MNRFVVALLAPMVLCAVMDAWAATDPAAKCQSLKVKAMGKYVACRTKAEAKAAVKGEAADTAALTKCADKFLRGWSKGEKKGAGTCADPPGSDETLAEATSDLYADWAGQYVAGGEPDICAGTCDQCDADLATCGDDLSTCQSDLAACQSQPTTALLVTGAEVSFGPGSDGDVQAGAPRSYMDNGDGTVTDLNTGLMWEKKDLSGGVHHWDEPYSWSMPGSDQMDGTILTMFLNELNDVDGGGADCFAGHCDWRIPNRKELASIVDLGEFNPAVDTVFNTGCVGGCTVLDCSCTREGVHWSSTTQVNTTNNAWRVGFSTGNMSPSGKTSSHTVRAVRGGL